MTITEQLQFSVLTAPVATLDRRTLSQAWYSALYGSGNTGTVERPRPAEPAAQSLHAQYVHGVPESNVRAFDRAPAARANAVKAQAQPEGEPQERRAPRSALARKIERAFLRRPSAPHKASFTIEGDGGRVHVLMHSHGAKIELVAICPPKALRDVAAALAQVRYALAMRGIDLGTQARTQASC